MERQIGRRRRCHLRRGGDLRGRHDDQVNALTQAWVDLIVVARAPTFTF